MGIQSPLQIFDPLVCPVGTTAVVQSSSIDVGRTGGDYGKIQISIPNAANVSSGGLFILGRPTTDADFVTIYSDLNMGNLENETLVRDVFLLPEMRVLLLNVVVVNNGQLVTCYLQS